MVQYTFRDEIDYAKRIIERDNRDIDVSWALELGKESKDSEETKTSKCSSYYTHTNRDVIEAVQATEHNYKHLPDSLRMDYTKKYLNSLIEIGRIDFDGSDKDLETMILNARAELMHIEHSYSKSSKYGMRDISLVSFVREETSTSPLTNSRNKNTQSPELKINWEVIEVDFKNKRSLVQIDLVLFSQEKIYSNVKKFGKLNGKDFIYKDGWHGECNNNVCSKSIWIEHGKMKFIEASFDMNISMGGLYVGTLHVQEFISLNYIA